MSGPGEAPAEEGQRVDDGLRIGDLAPDFTLPGADGRTGEAVEVSLSGLRGRPVVIAFYPADGTPVCTAQLTEYTRDIGSFQALDAAVLAISPQSPDSHREFAEANDGFGFPLLSDEDLAVGRSYGVVGLLDLYRRSTFVIDADGIVRYAHRYLSAGAGYRTTPDLVSVLSRI